MHSSTSNQIQRYSDVEFAVQICNGSKTHGNKRFLAKREDTNVLQNFNFNVPTGSLYSLLGSSGCGKTTVISCIAGICKLDKGRVVVFGRDKSCPASHPKYKVGYMPQETCLYTRLSIFENLMYFGTLCGFADETKREAYLMERIHYLRKLLRLPPGNHITGTLSGGQRQRLSFAVALVHEPDLLLLDEPTSAVDPITREFIWKHLRGLAETKGTTIILTTHYVDEAKNSSLIGVMRNGQMVAEGCPAQLMETYQLNSMEALYFALSQQQETSPQIPSRESSEPSSDPTYYDKDVFMERSPGSGSLRRIGALVHKNYKCMFRDYSVVAFLILLPAFILLVTCLGFQHEPTGISLGVVNNDIKRDNVQCDNITHDGFCHTEYLSCEVLNNLPAHILNLKAFESIDSAIQAVKDGHAWGYIHFSENFTSALTDRALTPVEAFEEEDGLAAWNSSKVTIQLDQSNRIMYAIILKTIYGSVETSLKTMLRHCDFDERIGEYPMQYKEPIFGDNTMSVQGYIASGVTIALVYMFSWNGATRLINERKQGTMERCVIGGAKTWEIFLSFLISEFTAVLLQCFFVVAVLHFAFSIVTYSQNLPLIYVLCVLQGLSGVASGLLLGVIFTEEVQAGVIMIFATLANSILSGTLWPIEGMPTILRWCSYAFPMTLSSEAFRSLVQRGWGFEHPNVWPGFLVPLAYTFVLTVMTALIIRTKFRQ